MNPYTKDVINATMPGMIQANALSQNQQANAANSATLSAARGRAFSKASRRLKAPMNVGQMLANLNTANFTQAQAAATGDINRSQCSTNRPQQTDLERQNTDLLANQAANAADLNRSLTAQTTNQGAQQAKINSDIQRRRG